MSRKTENGSAIRILMIVPHFPPPVMGGLEKQSQLLSKALAEDGYTVIIAARRYRADDKTKARENGCEVIRLSFGSGIFRILDSISHLLIPFLMFSRRNEYDIVHVHTIRIDGIIALLTARLLGKKTLQKIPDVGVYRFSESCKMLFGSMRSRVFRSSADSIAALSENSVQAMTSVGYPESRIFRITNGVAAESALSRNIERRQERLTVIFLGRLAHKKGIFDLLDAWELLISANKEIAVELQLFGRGPLESRIRKTIAHKSLADSVKLCGYADDVQSVLAAADILVLPSYEEGNSNSVLEAMAAGLPIISTRVGGTEILVGEAGRAFLHEPGDIRALSDILLRFIRDKNMRLEIGMRMRERALRHFLISDVKDKYVTAYRLLLDGKRDKTRDCSQFPPD